MSCVDRSYVSRWGINYEARRPNMLRMGSRVGGCRLRKKIPLKMSSKVSSTMSSNRSSFLSVAWDPHVGRFVQLLWLGLSMI